MITISIPGVRPLTLSDLVLDFNGTLACDGALCPGVAAQLNELARAIDIHVVTGDTYGSAAAQLASVQCKLLIVGPQDQAVTKRAFVQQLVPEQVVVIGNGLNDCAMMACAALSVAVLGPEGVASKVLATADVVAKDIDVALGLLRHPTRLVATLRL